MHWIFRSPGYGGRSTVVFANTFGDSGPAGRCGASPPTPAGTATGHCGGRRQRTAFPKLVGYSEQVGVQQPSRRPSSCQCARSATSVTGTTRAGWPVGGVNDQPLRVVDRRQEASIAQTRVSATGVRYTCGVGRLRACCTPRITRSACPFPANAISFSSRCLRTRRIFALRWACAGVPFPGSRGHARGFRRRSLSDSANVERTSRQTLPARHLRQLLPPGNRHHGAPEDGGLRCQVPLGALGLCVAPRRAVPGLGPDPGHFDARC